MHETVIILGVLDLMYFMPIIVCLDVLIALQCKSSHLLDTKQPKFTESSTYLEEESVPLLSSKIQ